jgi:hypothetical protein
MQMLVPWQVVAFWALLTTLGAWAWAPAQWHVAIRATQVGRALVIAFGLLTVAVYVSMLA